MPDELKTKLRLKIAHVLFIDIVGYLKLLIDEQSQALHELNQIVRNTEAVRDAEGAGQLIILPTGDGMRWSSPAQSKTRWNARSRSARLCGRSRVYRCGWVFTTGRCITSRT
ncbi:MAG: hypothetical protein ACR2FX_03510 [Chthoniobacterales bacterium]